MKARREMKSVWKVVFVLGFSLPLFAVEKAVSSEQTPVIYTFYHNGKFANGGTLSNT
jgi:hypothetical protein